MAGKGETIRVISIWYKTLLPLHHPASGHPTHCPDTPTHESLHDQKPSILMTWTQYIGKEQNDKQNWPICCLKNEQYGTSNAVTLIHLSRVKCICSSYKGTTRVIQTLLLGQKMPQVIPLLGLHCKGMGHQGNITLNSTKKWNSPEAKSHFTCLNLRATQCNQWDLILLKSVLCH